MRKHLLRTGLITTCLSFSLAFGQNDRGPSTTAERTRALATLDDLETNPLGPNAKDERSWLTTFLIQVPDIHVAICSGLLPDVPKGDNDDSKILPIQAMLSSARYAVQHGGGNTGSLEQAQAGVEGALVTYENIVKTNSADRMPAWDDLLKLRTDGSLRKYVKHQLEKSCKK